MIDSKGQPPVIIVGSGRSGTTWVLDATADANGMNTIFEPLHPILGATAQRYCNRYLVATDVEPELSRFMNSVLSGRHPGFWTRYRERPNRLYPSLAAFSSIGAAKHWIKRWQYVFQHHGRFRRKAGRSLIVKFIRANLMLSWIKGNFPCRILFVLRHPLAVIESKLRLGGEDWEHNALLNAYLDDSRLMDVLGADPDRVRKASDMSTAAANAALWCVENALPLAQTRELGLVTAFYEDLASDEGMSEWRRIMSALELRQVPSRSAVMQPSQQSSAETRQRLAEKNQRGIEEIQVRLGERQVSHVARMLEMFRITVYDVEHYSPVLGGIGGRLG